MIDQSDIARDLGRLEGAVEAMQSDIARMRISIETLTAIVQQSRGGLRMLSAIAGAGGVLGAALSTLWHRMTGGAQ